MPISRTKKQEIIKKISEKLAKAKALTFVQFHALSVAKLSAIRRALSAEGAEYTVAKKTLINVAFRDAGKEISGPLDGEVGIIFGYTDEILPFKSAVTISKKEKNSFAVLGGLFEGVFVDADTAKRIGSIPSREVLLAQLMQVIQGNTRKFVYVLDQMSKKSA